MRYNEETDLKEPKSPWSSTVASTPSSLEEIEEEKDKDKLVFESKAASESSLLSKFINCSGEHAGFGKG